MSDAINGGGGGGSDPMAMLQQILDPLGLFKGIGGGIDTLLKQSGDQANVSEFGGKLLNHVGSFSQQQGGDGSSPDANVGTDPTVTKYLAQSNESAIQGWAEPAPHESAPAEQGRTRQSTSAAQVSQAIVQGAKKGITGAIQSSLGEKPQPFTPVIQTAAQIAANQAAEEAAKLKQQKRDELKAMETEYGHMEKLMADFQAFDSQGWDKGGFCDQKFDRLNLQNVANDPNYPESIRNTAKYLLENPSLLAKLQAASGGGSGMVVLAVVKDHAEKLMGRIDAKRQEIAGGAGAGGSSGPNQTGPGGGAGPGVTPQTGTQFNQPGSELVVQKTETKQESSLDGRLAQMGQSLDDKRDELIALYNKPEGELTEAERRKLKSLPLEIEKASQRYSEMHNLVSNLMKSFHDMSMNSIRHIG